MSLLFMCIFIFQLDHQVRNQLYSHILIQLCSHHANHSVVPHVNQYLSRHHNQVISPIKFHLCSHILIQLCSHHANHSVIPHVNQYLSQHHNQVISPIKFHLRFHHVNQQDSLVHLQHCSHHLLLASSQVVCLRDALRGNRPPDQHLNQFRNLLCSHSANPPPSHQYLLRFSHRNSLHINLFVRQLINR